MKEILIMKVLLINASTRGAESQSLSIAERLISSLSTLTTVDLDVFHLFDGTLPPFDGNAVGAKMALFTGGEADTPQKLAWDGARKIFDRFAAADVYIFAAPLWNNGIPYVLKQFIDIVTQPGWAFGFDMEKGYTGLLNGKSACVVHASGVYHEHVHANFGSDFATPYLDDWLQFIGVGTVRHIHVAPTVVNLDFSKTKAQAERQADTVAKELAHLATVHR
jgi:FMN-dependent NADH-azoreductase